jgi:hypothetical protein
LGNSITTVSLSDIKAGDQARDQDCQLAAEISVDFDFGYSLGVMIGGGGVTQADADKVITSIIGHGCGHKHLPEWFLSTDKEFRLGLFAGLLDTDGGVEICQPPAKNKPGLIVNYTAVNLRLAQEIQLLAATLGIAAIISVSRTSVNEPVWVVCFSNGDIKKWGGYGLQSDEKREKIKLAEVSVNAAASAGTELLPMPFSLLDALLAAIGSKKTPKTGKDWVLAMLYAKMIASREGYKRAGRTPRLVAEEICRVVSNYGIKIEHTFWKKWEEIVCNRDVVWEYIAGIEKTGCVETGYDLTVPGYETFADSNGIILSNTMNFHVPMSAEAVKESFELLLPSKSLVQTHDMKSPQPRIISENSGGLFLATLPPDKKQKPRTFISWQDAEKAYKRGELAIDDPVVILSSKALPKGGNTK